MERVLTTHEATVQTVQVEIKALKVGKKQVTMGLFRQLPPARLIDPKTVQLRGVPWGHVRYFWDGDGSEPHYRAKLHVVWQLGDELRRAVVYEAPDPGMLRQFEKRIQGLIDDWVIRGIAYAKSFHLGRAARFETLREVKIDDVTTHAEFDDALARLLETYWNNRDIDPHAEAERNVEYMRQHYSAEQVAETYTRDHARAKDRKEAALQGYHGLLVARGLTEATLGTITQQIREVRKECQEYQDAWAKQWQVLRALPQLFIAV